MRSIGLWLALIAGSALTLPVLLLLLPVFGLLELNRRRRLKSVASDSVCQVCDLPLGLRSLVVARQRRRKALDEASRLGIRLRLRRLDAICPGCGTAYVYDRRQRTLLVDLIGRAADE